MADPLLFLLAPAAALPESGCSIDDLRQAQRLGPRGGFALRLFSLGRTSDLDLAGLPLDGSFTGAQRRSADGSQLICDAVVPHFEPQQHWLGVYGAGPDGRGPLTRLDCFALSEASNETCWFYPTHDGSYLSWEQGLRLTLAPGQVAEGRQEAGAPAYQRQSIAVLWSLLADDHSLSCVGLTYGGQRIDWPLSTRIPEPMATWSRFRVDSEAETSLVVEACQTVFDAPSPQP